MKINLFNYTISIFKKKKKRKYKIKSFIHRWIRAESISWNKAYSHNRRSSKLRSGYELVKANKYRNKFPVIDKGRFKGFIGVGGLVLATIPKKMVEAKREYLNQDYMKHRNER